MARHVALLRAINVGGRTVKMDVLRGACEALGLTSVETFIASGNVIFESRARAAVLEEKIETHLGSVLERIITSPATFRNVTTVRTLADKYA